MARRRKVMPGPYAREQRATLFWMEVDRRGPDECWPWTGYRNPDDYGMFHDGTRMRMAHELALTYATGETKGERLDTCHSCHNPPCCNPGHLRFDTRQSNVDDCIRAGRDVRGERVSGAKMTGELVLLLRERHAAGARVMDLAADYGLSDSTVSQIVTGNAWSHIGGPIRRSRGNYKGRREPKCLETSGLGVDT